jgi:hypothetical protein
VGISVRDLHFGGSTSSPAPNERTTDFGPLQGLAKILAALVNPLTVIYAILCTRKSAFLSLLLYAGAIVAGCVTINIFLEIAGVRLLIGYYFWGAGIALILISPLIDHSPAIAGWLRKR